MVEHRLERVARAAGTPADALDPALHGGQHGAEQLRHLGMGAEEEAFVLFLKVCDGTRLETRGVGAEIDLLCARRERRRREVAQRQRSFHVVAEPAHGHALRVGHPAFAVACRAGLEQERHEDVGPHPGEATLGERRAQRRAHATGALDAQERPRAARRHAEAILGIAIDAAEAEVPVQAPRDDVGEQRRDAREAAGFHLHGQAQAPIELEGVCGFEVVLERGDLWIQLA